MIKNYYNILEISEDATEAQIKKAYRSLAKKYHPDKSDSVHSEQLFTEINQAYEILSDPDQKLIYDQRRRKPQGEVEPRHVSKRQYRRRPTYSSSRGQTMDVGSYVPYFRIASYIAVVLSLTLSIDFLLPRAVQREHIIEVQRVMAQQRGGGTYIYAIEVITDNGIFSLDPNSSISFDKDQNLNVYRTVLLNKATLVKFSNDDETEGYSIKASIYGNFSFSLLILLITSVLGSWLKKPPMTILNFGIVNAILIVLVLYFTAIS